MNDEFVLMVASIKDFMEARKHGETDRPAFFRAFGHGGLFIADMIDGKQEQVVIGDGEAVSAAADDLKRLCESITGQAFPKIPMGTARGRNGEILRLAIPILIKYLLPLLLAEAGPAIASAALLSMIDG